MSSRTFGNSNEQKANTKYNWKCYNAAFRRNNYSEVTCLLRQILSFKETENIFSKQYLTNNSIYLFVFLSSALFYSFLYGFTDQIKDSVRNRLSGTSSMYSQVT